ncbi:hypothetical protein H6G54_00650 [Anabaena cylindrica FACHB-243]|uniref:Peptidase domain protein n=1 Tax=Anabaena cylindrica (strain ATCC 27899 / PCC 7122) TaxID=272123 RepID=K9ZD94_ANACC|nr:MULTISPECIES: hypothetical protein [Anabaena]AFZ56582.1 hypothetical protein Anacy_1007 [Anabaena cylindrica PCC 7122]MBD2416245.1 hypothetical protein [Anabaena cylindrica FACHB-243]MBY5283172.1 hypothetical protein [Anabaena sp. CCAP 1446/1C]MBY5307725.1 hypothetical protein [Anabaena sp. CCAP 1446/1C]MCM2408876.1 hypothetical protein [Anabaena sp. CCAP 1446/1C]
MRDRRFWLHFRGGWLLATIIAMIATPVAAETANFGTLKLSPGFEPGQGTVTGYTGGSYSLSAMSNRDRDKNICIGFGDPNPDHILVLEKDFDQMKIQVKSGYDTTLFIQGPDDQTIRCGDDTGRNKDANVSDRQWKRGKYRIWVGTFNRGFKHNYTLTVEQ